MAQEAKDSGDRIREEGNLREGVREGASAEEKFAYHGAVREHGREDTVEFIDVEKAFGRNKVLDGLNLGIPDGMITMILNMVLVHLIGMLGSQVFWGANPRAPIGG